MTADIIPISRLPKQIEMPEQPSMISQTDDGVVLWYFNVRHQVLLEQYYVRVCPGPKAHELGFTDQYNYKSEQWSMPGWLFDRADLAFHVCETYEELRDDYNSTH